MSLQEWAEKARAGGGFFLNGEKLSIEEVVSYHHGAEKWVNLLTHRDGREVAAEAVEGEERLTLWERIRKIRGLKEYGCTLNYQGEKYFEVERGVARAIVETAEETESANVPYRVYRTKSGRRIAVEIWDRQIYCYVAEPAAPQVSF
ncbi:MAG: DUF4178 domain-containing protein [Candidatus Nealsonbacteria bacterium]|nr:DUF4178 domain-containing protein [Candidatus Nealsonbacteria bacterium]